MTESFIPLSFTHRTDAEMQERAQAFRELMQTRRSVRTFSTEPVDQSIIENAILTAGSAPSGANRQPWHFVAIQDASMKKAIREAAEEEEREFYQRRAPQEWLDALKPFGTNEDKPMLEEAPWLIAVFLKKFTYDEKDAQHKNYYTSESVGLATGMLITALHQAGLATLTHTPSPMKFLHEILERPDYEKPYMLIVAGLPAENVQVPNIEKYPLDEIATFK